MHRLKTSVAALLLFVLALPGSAAAHIGAEAFILVPADHVIPGQPFEVIAADLSPDSNINFRIERDELVVPLQTAKAGPDGHFESMLSLPGDFPTGYANLIAAADDGSQASTWILVGERTATTPSPPNSGTWWTDPSVLVLLAFLVGAAGVIGYLLLRPRRATIKAVPATPRRAPVPRKRDRSSS